MPAPSGPFQGYCDRVPQTGWCEAIEMYSFTVLEAGSSKSRSQQDRAPSEAPGRSLPGLLQLLAVAVVPGCSSSVCCHMSSCASRSSQCISLFLSGYQSYWVRAQPNALILTWLYLQTPYFQKRSYSQVPGLGPRHVFCVDRIQPVEPSLLNVETLGSVDFF